MQRRQFIQLSTIAASAGSFGSVFAAVSGTTAGWRNFEITTTVDLSEKTAQSKVWIPVPAAELPGYQRTVDVSFNAPGATKAELYRVPGTDARMIAVQWADASAPTPWK